MSIQTQYREAVADELAFEFGIAYQSLHRREWRFIDACQRAGIVSWYCAGLINRLRR